MPSRRLLCLSLLTTTAFAQISDPAADIFVNSRALKVHSVPADANTFRNSPIARAYEKIRPERSILLSDCRTFNCTQDFLGFRSILTATARVANPSAPDAAGLYRSWYDRASAPALDRLLIQTFPFQPLDSEPFQLLAVANRLDTASWNQSAWSGAELHFAYGLKPANSTVGPRDLIVILEFELAPQTAPAFAQLARTWAGLSEVPAAQYPSALRAALVASGIPMAPGDKSGVRRVRLRMNHNLNGGAWQFTQLLLDPAVSPKFVPAKLDDQIRNLTVTSELAALWLPAQQAVQAGTAHFVIPERFLEGPSIRFANDKKIGMAMPRGVCGISEPTRNLLAIQQCTGCHTAETGAGFTHIGNRRSNESSKLSAFLTGPAKILRPSLVDLYNGNEKVVWKATVPYKIYSGPGCTNEGDAVPPATNKFHDVARRTLFLASLVADSGGNAIPVAQRLASRTM